MGAPALVPVEIRLLRLRPSWSPAEASQRLVAIPALESAAVIVPPVAPSPSREEVSPRPPAPTPLASAVDLAEPLEAGATVGPSESPAGPSPQRVATGAPGS